MFWSGLWQSVQRPIWYVQKKNYVQAKRDLYAIGSTYVTRFKFHKRPTSYVKRDLYHVHLSLTHRSTYMHTRTHTTKHTRTHAHINAHALPHWHEKRRDTYAHIDTETLEHSLRHRLGCKRHRDTKAHQQRHTQAGRHTSHPGICMQNSNHSLLISSRLLPCSKISVFGPVPSFSKIAPATILPIPALRTPCHPFSPQPQVPSLTSRYVRACVLRKESMPRR